MKVFVYQPPPYFEARVRFGSCQQTRTHRRLEEPTEEARTNLPSTDSR